MKKISFIVFLLFFSIGKAATIQVGANFPVKKIKQALALAKDGDTILVHSGIYKEGTILINKKINTRKNTYTVRDLLSWYGKIGVTFHGKCLYEFTLDTFILTRP